MEQFFSSCFCVQQQVFEYSVSYKAGTSKLSNWPNCHVLKWLVEKEINKKFFAEADSLLDKSLSCSRIKLSSSKILVMDCGETGFLLQTLLNN